MRSNVKSNQKYLLLFETTKENLTPFILYILIMKLDFTHNTLFFIISYFLRLVGICIRCCNFVLNEEMVKNPHYKTITKFYRKFTAYNCIKTIKLTNKHYVILSFIIIALFLIRLILVLRTYYTIKIIQNNKKLKFNLMSGIKSIKNGEGSKKDELNKNINDMYMNFSPFKYEIIMMHISFILFPCIIEFLSFIYYILIFPDTFVIKRDNSFKIYNYVLAFINGVLIITYNINGIIQMIIVNRPYNLNYTPVKYRYPKIQFFIMFFLQNLILINCLSTYLEGNSLKLYKIITAILMGLILLYLFFLSYKQYNYNVFTNKMIQFFVIYLFISICCEVALNFLKYCSLTYKTLLCSLSVQLIIALLINFIINRQNYNLLQNICILEIFSMFKGPQNRRVYDSFLFFLEKAQESKLDICKKETEDIFDIFFKHQLKCSKKNCKCKILNLVPQSQIKDFQKFKLSLINRICFLIETCFINLDYYNDFNLAVLLAEIYCNLKDKPLISYSIIQTILSFHYENLTTLEIIKLYELAKKYLDKYKITQRNNIDLNYEKSLEVREIITFSQYYSMIEKLTLIERLMDHYIKNIMDIIKSKETFESSIKLKIDEDEQRIESISSSFITKQNIETVINNLKIEDALFELIVIYTKNLDTLLLDHNIPAPISFHYKIFLFVDLFLEGKIPEGLKDIMYSFSYDKNIQLNIVPKYVYGILKRRYDKENCRTDSKFFSIFEMAAGIRARYVSEPLMRKLGYKKEELMNENLSKLLPRVLSSAHTSEALRRITLEENIFFPNSHMFLFDKDFLLLSTYSHGAAIYGLSRAVFIFLKIEINYKEGEYFFLLDKDFNLFSLSKSFYDKYKINLDIVNKYNLKILNLFNIKEDNVRKYFSKIIRHHDTVIAPLNMDTSIPVLRKLFRGSAKERSVSGFFLSDIGGDNDKDERRINKIKIDCEKLYGDYDGIDRKKGRIKAEYKGEVKKENVRMNLKKNSEIFVNEDNEKNGERIALIIEKFKDTDDIDKSPNSPKKNSSSQVGLKGINIIIEEYKKESNEKETDHLIDANSSTKYDKASSFTPTINPHIFSTTLSVKYLGNIHYFQLRVFEASHPQVIESNNNISNAGSARTRMSTVTSVTHKTISSAEYTYAEDIDDYINKVVVGKKHCIYLSIREMMFGIILIVVIIYILILFVQAKEITTSKEIYEWYFYNYNQRDLIVEIESLLLSAYFLLSKFSEYDDDIKIGTEEYTKLAFVLSKELDLANYKFLTYYNNFKNSRGEDNASFNRISKISKLKVNWEPVYTDTMTISEVKYVTYYGKSIKIEEDKLEDDIKNYWALDFEKLKGKLVNTDFMRLLFYLDHNMLEMLESFKIISLDALNTFDHHTKISKYEYISLEIFTSLLFFFSFIFMLLYIYGANIKIFQYLIHLFLENSNETNKRTDSSQGLIITPYSFNNKESNFIIIRKLTLYSHLLNNFSETAINRFDSLYDIKGKLNFSMASEYAESIKDEMKDSRQTTNTKDKKKRDNKNNKKEPKNVRMKSFKFNKKDGNKDDFNESTNSKISSSQNQLITKNNDIISKINQRPQNIKEQKQDTINNGIHTEQKESNVELNQNSIFELLPTIRLSFCFKYFVVVIFFVVALIAYLIIKLKISLSFNENINNIFKDYHKFTGCFYTLTEALCAYLSNLITPTVGFYQNMVNFTSSYNEELLESQQAEMERMHKYALSKEFVDLFAIYEGHKGNEAELKNDIKEICYHGYEDLVYLNEYDKEAETMRRELCIQVLNTNYNILADGLYKSLRFIGYTLGSSIKEYIHFIGKKGSINDLTQHNFEEVKKMFSNRDLNLYIFDINFLISLIRSIWSEHLYLDKETLINTYQKQIKMLNIFSICFSLLVLIYVTAYMIVKVKDKILMIEKGTVRIIKGIYSIKQKCQ